MITCSMHETCMYVYVFSLHCCSTNVDHVLDYFWSTCSLYSILCLNAINTNIGVTVPTEHHGSGQGDKISH